MSEIMNDPGAKPDAPIIREEIEALIAMTKENILQAVDLWIDDADPQTLGPNARDLFWAATGLRNAKKLLDSTPPAHTP